MEPFPTGSEFIDSNQEKLGVLRVLTEQSLLNPEGRLTIIADGSLNLEFDGDIPEGVVAKNTFGLYPGEIPENDRRAIIDIDEKAQMDAARELIRASIIRVAMYKVAMNISGEADVDETAWPPFGFENINYYSKSTSDGVTINLIEIKGMQGVSDSAEITIKAEDGVVAKSLHLLCIGNQTVDAISLVGPANDEQLRVWLSRFSVHADEIEEILTLGFRMPIDELESRIDDLSERLIDEGYNPNLVSQTTREMYDRIVALKAQIEMMSHADITTPDQEDLVYFEKMLTKSEK
jgi:hypothetical protein